MVSKKQKKKIRNYILVLLLIVLSVLATWLFFQWKYYQDAVKSQYPAFGIIMPGGFTIHGIDVSKHQRFIAWNEVKKMEVDGIKIHFCFIKATEGSDRTDVQFSRNWQQAKANGIVRGAYHFFNPYTKGKKQAENFMDEVELEKGDLPPVLDIEQYRGGSLIKFRKEALEWLQLVEAKYGVKPILYTNVAFYKQILGDAFDSYPLWVAHYNQPTGPRIGRNWVFWQHNETGMVNGIAHDVDFNVFNGDSVAFSKLLIPN
jgi:lysozyme